MATLQTLDFLPPFAFKLILNRTPSLEYFCQNFEFPGVSLNNLDGPQTPFNKLIIPGDHTTWEDFSVTFKIDAGMYNYFEIYDWIKALGFPDNFTQYASIAAQSQSTGLGPEADVSLMILSAQLEPLVKVVFKDVIPANLSGFSFDSTKSSVDYLTARATFKYREYSYERIV